MRLSSALSSADQDRGGFARETGHHCGVRLEPPQRIACRLTIHRDFFRRSIYYACHHSACLDGITLVSAKRFFTHGRSAYGDRLVYAARTRFIPDELLGLFNRTAWPAAAA
jgi:hypothetical protein